MSREWERIDFVCKNIPTFERHAYWEVFAWKFAEKEANKVRMQVAVHNP